MKKQAIEWIPESEAARLLDLKPRTLRKYVKGTKQFFPKLNIAMTNVSGRKYQYNRFDIENLLLQSSSARKTA